jgi:penicillin-binding protein 1A
MERPKSEQLRADNERYFPNHALEHDIGLAEYNLAASRLSTEEQALNWSTNTTVLVATAVGFVSFRASEYEKAINEAGISDQGFKTFFLICVIFFGFLSINHIANLIKSRVFSERKIITLRRMLGVKYGQQSLILPNWRLEGADNPLSIRLFSGYFSFRAFPIHVLLIVISFSIVILSPEASRYISKSEFLLGIRAERTGIFLAAIWCIAGLLVYRRALNEANEGGWLYIARFAAKFLGITLVSNFEIAIYNVKLEIAEIVRIKTSLDLAKKLAIFIEDRSFASHRGINWRGVARVIWRRFRRKSAGGGSSITQQLARSQFIVRPSLSIRRKIVEMLIAKWLESIFPKEEILVAYLATSRFENGVYGFHRALAHFFSGKSLEVAPWQAFVLIERLGNVRGRFLGRRILQIGRAAIAEKVLTKEDFISAIEYYESQIGIRFAVETGNLTPSEILLKLAQPDD